MLTAVLLSTGVATDIQSTALSPMVGAITADLRLSSTQVSWALNAYFLTGAISVGLTSRMGDKIGHRKVLMALAMTGLCGGVVGGLSNGFVMLLISRALLGLALTTPLAWGLMRTRARAEQVQSAALSLGTVTMIFTAASLLLGGVLVSIGAGWQAVFWIMAAAFGVMLALSVRAPETPPTARSMVVLDWPGALGLGISLASLLLALSEGGTYGWGSPFVVTLLGISAVALIAWLMQQRRSAAPLMDFRNMNVRQMSSGYIAIFTTVLVSFALYTLLPTMLQAPVGTGYGHGSDLLEATLPLVMILPGSFAAASLEKLLLTRWGPRAPIVVGGLSVMVAFLGMAFLRDVMWPFYLWVFIYAVGAVMCYNLGWSLVAASGRQDNTSITFGMLVAGQMVTASVISAVVVAVLNLGAVHLPAGSTYSGLYGSMALAALVFFVFFGLFVVPKRLEDRHAVTQPF
jgi:MFS family permease